MNYQFIVANDNGNAEQDIIINGEEFRDSNAYARADDLKGYLEMNPATVVTNIMDNLLVDISSQSCLTGTYLIGKSAITSPFKLNQTHVGFDKKNDSEIPIISTLGKIAAYAVKQRYDEVGEQLLTSQEDIDVAVEMATSLPIDEYYEDEDNKEKFSKRFTEHPHTVHVYLGRIRIRVTIKFMHVVVTPEAIPVFFFLKHGCEDKEVENAFLAEYRETYNEPETTGNTLSTLRTLHIDIGSGTTEFPIVTKKGIDPGFKRGEHLGIGYAIGEAMNDFKKLTKLRNVKRLEFDEYIKDDNNRFHERAVLSVDKHLKDQADEISAVMNEEIMKSGLDVDLILIYGGGSILLKDALMESVKEIADTAGAKILFAPKDYAARLNALGLEAYTRTKKFKKTNVLPKDKKGIKEEVEA